MVLIIIQDLFVIQMLIRQDLLLIEDLHLSIVSQLMVIWSHEKVRNKVLWQDPVQKQNIELWPQLPVNLFILSNCLESYNLEMSLKWHLCVTIRPLFILTLILSFMRGLNILRLIVISFEKRLALHISSYYFTFLP